MARVLFNDLRAGRSNATILNALRPTQRDEALAAPFFLEETRKAAWQWGLTIDDEYICGAAIMPDVMPGRGWFVAYAGKALVSPFQIRPMFQLFRDLARLGPYDELRAWVLDGFEREERFARWFGFELDCGPASGFSPTGRDMNLWIWRRT